MDRLKSLVNWWIGGLYKTKKYYDKWANTYDETLNQWKYTAPKKSNKFINKKIKIST